MRVGFPLSALSPLSALPRLSCHDIIRPYPNGLRTPPDALRGLVDVVVVILYRTIFFTRPFGRTNSPGSTLRYRLSSSDFPLPSGRKKTDARGQTNRIDPGRTTKLTTPSYPPSTSSRTCILISTTKGNSDPGGFLFVWESWTIYSSA